MKQVYGCRTMSVALSKERTYTEVLKKNAETNSWICERRNKMRI
jgi:hypothetical protein